MKLFPSVSVSQLRANLERDRQKLNDSTAELQATIRHKTRPVRFFLDHPTAIIGGLTSLLALYEVGTAVIPFKIVAGPAGKTLGVMGRLARVGLGFAMKAATPAVSTVIQKLWKHALGGDNSKASERFPS